MKIKFLITFFIVLLFFSCVFAEQPFFQDVRFYQKVEARHLKIGDHNYLISFPTTGMQNNYVLGLIDNYDGSFSGVWKDPVTSSTGTLQQITENGNVTTNEVKILNYFTANDVIVNNDITADRIIADGSLLTNLQTNLQDVIDINNNATGEILLNGTMEANLFIGKYQGNGSKLTGLILPLQDVLSAGNSSNFPLYITNTINAVDLLLSGSALIHGNLTVSGDIYGNKYYGDGSSLTGISSTLQQITNNGNTTTNEVIINNTLTSTNANITNSVTAGQVNIYGDINMLGNINSNGDIECSNIQAYGNITSEVNISKRIKVIDTKDNNSVKITVENKGINANSNISYIANNYQWRTGINSSNNYFIKDKNTDKNIVKILPNAKENSIIINDSGEVWIDKLKGDGSGLTGINGGVSSVNSKTGEVILNSDNIDEGINNLYYTENRVSNNTDVLSNTNDRHSHANKTLLDTYNQTNSDITNAVNHISRTDNPHNVTTTQIGAVSITGNETISGIKTFSNFPVTPNNQPVNNYDVANKKYVDDSVASSGGGDMLKIIYDKNDNGIVDNSEYISGTQEVVISSSEIHINNFNNPHKVGLHQALLQNNSSNMPIYISSGSKIKSISGSGTVNYSSSITSGSNIYAQNFLGNGSGLTGINSDVNSVNNQTGIVSLYTDDITEGTNNLYFTNSRVDNNSNVILNSQHRAIISGNPHNVTSGMISTNTSNFDNQLSISDNTIQKALNTLDNIKVPVNSVNNQTGAVSLYTTNITEGTNLYYTETRVANNIEVSANSNHRSRTDNPHNVTLDQVTSIGNITTNDISVNNVTSNNIKGNDLFLSGNADVTGILTADKIITSTVETQIIKYDYYEEPIKENNKAFTYWKNDKHFYGKNDTGFEKDLMDTLEIEVSEGLLLDKVQVNILENGTNIYAEIQKLGGGDITFIFRNRRYILDCTPAISINLISGTSIDNQQLNYIYAHYNSSNDNIEILNSVNKPTGNFYVNVAKVMIPDLISFQNDNNSLFILQIYNNQINDNGKGNIIRISERLRQNNPIYSSGIAINVKSINNNNDIDLQFGNGELYRINKQSFPPLQMLTDGVYLGNGVDKYQKVNSWQDIRLMKDKYGNTHNWVNDTQLYYFWGVINNNGKSKIFVNLPERKYNQSSHTSDDVFDRRNYLDRSIPNEFKSNAFGIGYLALAGNNGLIYLIQERKNNSVSTGVSNFQNELGQNISYSAGSQLSQTIFSDKNFSIVNESDSSKAVTFDVSNVTTGTTRNVKIADENIDMHDITLNSIHRNTTSGNPHNVNADDVNCLAKDNTSVYNPTGNYNPATKKYVDDKFSGVYVVEEVYNHASSSGNSFSINLSGLGQADGRTIRNVKVYRNSDNQDITDGVTITLATNQINVDTYIALDVRVVYNITKNF